MLPPSILPRARDRGGRAKGYIDPAGDVPPHPPEAPALAFPSQPASGRAAEQRVGAVGTQPDGDERGAEHDYLRPGRTPRRIYELGQERQEEQRGLRVEHVHDHALQEDAREVVRLDGCGDLLLISGAESLQAEPDQVRRAQPLHRAEGGRGGRQQHREPDSGESDVHEAAYAHAEDGGEAGRTSLVDAAGDDVDYRGTWHEQQRKRGGYEESERGRVWHRLSPTWPQAPGAAAGRGRGSRSGAGTPAPRRRT